MERWNLPFFIKYFLRENKKALENHYKIEITDEEQKDEDCYSIIEKLARKRAFMLKGGIPDENRAINLLVREWQDGRLRLYKK
jgi:ribosome biogenesis GTPase A